MGFVGLCPLIESVLLSARDGIVLVEREKGEWVRVRVHSKCEDGWFEELVNEFLVGWGVVGIDFERDIIEILLEWGVVGILLEWVFLGDSSSWACWCWSGFCSGEAEFFGPLSLLFKFWVTSIGMCLLVWVFLGLGEILVWESFALLVEVVMEGSFGSLLKEIVWFYFWSPEQVPWVPVYLVSDRSVSSAFLGVSLFLLRVTWVHPSSVLGGFSASEVSLVASTSSGLGSCVVSAFFGAF